MSKLSDPKLTIDEFDSSSTTIHSLEADLTQIQEIQNIGQRCYKIERIIIKNTKLNNKKKKKVTFNRKLTVAHIESFKAYNREMTYKRNDYMCQCYIF
jgi:hypothetical protein